MSQNDVCETAWSADDGRLNVSHNLFFPSFLYVCVASFSRMRDHVVMLVCVVVFVYIVSQEVNLILVTTFVLTSEDLKSASHGKPDFNKRSEVHENLYSTVPVK